MAGRIGAPVHRFLLRFTPARALVVFAAALGSGTLAVVLGYHPEALVPASILAYGILLVTAQRRYLILLNSTVKDSPYFLGFILTLVVLAKLFHDLANSNLAEAAAVSARIPAIAAALLATGLGLLLRQVLYSLDPAETARDEAFQSVMDAVRERSNQFHDAQQRLVHLISEFTDVRERMFSDEATAHRRFLEALDHRQTALLAYETAFTERIGSVEKTLATSEEALERTVTAVRERLDAAVTHLGRSVEAVGKAFAESQVIMVSAAVSGHESLQGAIATLGNTVVSVTTSVQGQLDAASATLQETSGLQRQLVSDVEGMRTGLTAVTAGVTGLVGDLERLGQLTAEFTSAYREAGNTLSGGANQLIHTFTEAQAASLAASNETALRSRRMVEEALQDLAEADKVATQVITLLTRRVADLSEVQRA